MIGGERQDRQFARYWRAFLELTWFAPGSQVKCTVRSCSMKVTRYFGRR